MTGSAVEVDRAGSAGALRMVRTVTWTVLLVAVTATVTDQLSGPWGAGSVWVPAMAGAATAALSAIAALWAEGERLPRVSAGLLLTLAASWAPVVAVARWAPERAEAVLVGTWCLLPAGLLAVATAWASPGPRTVALVAGPSGLAAVGVAAAYRSLDDPGCTWRCGSGSVPFAGWAETTHVVAGSVVLVATAAVAGAWWATRHLRVLPTPVYGGVVAALAAVLVLSGLRVTTWGLTAGPPSRAGWLLIPSTACAAGVLWFAAATLLARRRLRALAARLEALEDGEKTTGWVLHFARPGPGGWVDDAGRPVDVEPDERRLLVVRDATGAPWVRLVSPPAHRSPIARGADVASAWDATQWLLVQNARDAALSRAGRREVEASRRRVVAASDAERRRIERDLHDGVQQRLVAAKLHLALGRRHAGGTAAAPLLAAEHHTQVALDGLREVSHGLFPRALVTEGLVRALEDLAGHRGIRLEIAAGLPEMAVEVRTAGYAVVRRLTGPEDDPRSGARVRLTKDGTSLVVTVALQGPTREDAEMALVELEDRVGALGGVLRVDRATAGLRVEAVLPCVS